jgi:peptidoglycan/xylan/chitin deacetylase (PgdA/CDA1 family)
MLCRDLRQLKSSTATVRTEVMSALKSSVHNLPDHRWRYLTWDQLRELTASPLITIGGHTHSHLVLDAVSRAEMTADIERGRQLLQSRLRVDVQHFSCPYGHHNQTVRRTVRNLGFQCAMETDRNLSRRSSDLYRIPRVSVTNETAFNILNPYQEASVGTLRPTSTIRWESTDATGP